MEVERKPFQCELSSEDMRIVEAVEDAHPEQQLKVRLTMFYKYFKPDLPLDVPEFSIEEAFRALFKSFARRSKEELVPYIGGMGCFFCKSPKRGPGPFTFHKRRNLWYCFNCWRGGSAYQAVMEHRKCKLNEAYDWLKEHDISQGENHD